MPQAVLAPVKQVLNRGNDSRTGVLQADAPAGEVLGAWLLGGSDAHRQFVPMQRALARSDALNEYIEHTGSALFACPPGLGADGHRGTQPFA